MIDTKNVVTAIAYMIGVRKYILEKCYSDECRETLDKLYNCKEATVIRYLCKLRTTLMQKFKKTDMEMKYNLKNLNSLEWFDADNIKQLEKWGIPIIQANYESEKYAQDFTRLIEENIDNCAHLFRDWIKWDYIKDMFCIPKYLKSGTMKAEFNKYMANIDYYPFQVYIHWKNPSEQGGILLSDRKFIKAMYSWHNDVFNDYSKYRDADEETKNNIYAFINKSSKTAIAVDCENSNVFKLYSVLKGLNPDELAKIEKITLYDDIHTTSAWSRLEQFISIPVEYICIDRVTDRKSLVDIKMTAGVTKDFYKNNIDSFILVSSDSDFWGLISTLSDANFLVMYEYDKCGQAIKSALGQHEIFHCAIDDFCSANTGELKKTVLIEELKKHFPEIYGQNLTELTYKLYEDTKITATKKEMETFCSKYVKTLKLKVDSDNTFTFEITG